MNDEIKVGDVVLLNSGSPRLTVIGIDGASLNQTIYVTWIDDRKVVNSPITVPIACVTKYAGHD